jgi:4-diphosphocytidyl-2-C-methyl-D-erythritol kinase
VYPLPDLPAYPCVIATPEIGVSTPKAFADWDALTPSGDGFELSPESTHGEDGCSSDPGKLTGWQASARMEAFGRRVSSWLSGVPGQKVSPGRSSGVPAGGRGRAEIPLLDLVRTGIENDFERVVFPQYPELREVKRVLERSGAQYASLSGSGSALYGLFQTRAAAERTAAQLRKAGVPAQATSTLTRAQYWKKFRV